MFDLLPVFVFFGVLAWVFCLGHREGFKRGHRSASLDRVEPRTTLLQRALVPVVRRARIVRVESPEGFAAPASLPRRRA